MDRSLSNNRTKKVLIKAMQDNAILIPVTIWSAFFFFFLDVYQCDKKQLSLRQTRVDN